MRRQWGAHFVWGTSPKATANDMASAALPAKGPSTSSLTAYRWKSTSMSMSPLRNRSRRSMLSSTTVSLLSLQIVQDHLTPRGHSRS